MRGLIVILSVALAFVLGISGVFENEAMYGRIHADAQGYYGYLVALFLERSFDWETVIHSYSDVYFSGSGADFTVQTEFGRINKYYVGTAILILPFFLLSCLAALILGFPVDGYSEPFHIGIMLGALVYAGIGIYFLSKFLESKGIRKSISLFSSVACLFATGVFHYSIAEPAMSHVYSFALFCGFLYSVDRWVKNKKDLYLYAVAAVFAMVVLVRPANGLLLLSVPFIAGGWRGMKERLTTTDAIGRKVVLSGLIVVAILSIQSIMYLAQVGKPIVWSYQGEGFNFFDPEVLNVLFSFRKGYFVYTPIAFLGLIGLIWFLFTKTAEALWLWLFLAISVYVISSWWNWYYGGSFGMRALIEFTPFFAFGLAFLIQNSRTVLKASIITACVLLMVVNEVQCYQYQKFILHWDSMNQDKYWQVFLKTDRKYDGIFYRQPNVEEVTESVIDTKVFSSDLEPENDWGPQGITDEKAFSGTQSTKVSASNKFGSTLGVPVAEMGINGRKKLKLSAMVWAERALPDLAIAYSYRDSAGDYGHEYIGVGQLVLEEEQWVKIERIVDLGSPRDSSDHWIVYPLSNDEGDVYLDDIRYEILTVE